MYTKELLEFYKKNKNKWLITFIVLYSIVAVSLIFLFIFINKGNFALMISLFMVFDTLLLLIATYIVLNNYLSSYKIYNHFKTMINSKGMRYKVKLVKIIDKPITLTQSIQVYPVIVNMNDCDKQLYISVYVDHSNLNLSNDYEIEIISQFIKSYKKL